MTVRTIPLALLLLTGCGASAQQLGASASPGRGPITAPSPATDAAPPLEPPLALSVIPRGTQPVAQRSDSLRVATQLDVVNRSDRVTDVPQIVVQTQLVGGDSIQTCAQTSQHTLGTMSGLRPAETRPVVVFAECPLPSRSILHEVRAYVSFPATDQNERMLAGTVLVEPSDAVEL